MKGERRQAKDIPYRLVMGEENGESISEHPFSEELDWLKQFCGDCPATGFYLVAGDETAPSSIWHGDENHIEGWFTCLYEDVDETEADGDE